MSIVHNLPQLFKYPERTKFRRKVPSNVGEHMPLMHYTGRSTTRYFLVAIARAVYMMF